MRRAWPALLASVVLLCAPAAAEDAKLKAYGRHLSAECSACHRIDGTDNGIPSITGWEAVDFIRTLGFYKDGSRTNAAMNTVAQSLDEEQMRALAAYYGSLPKGPHRSSAAPAAGR